MVLAKSATKKRITQAKTATKKCDNGSYLHITH